jgi:antitoxin component YwqK of YwqJK toxin-antitoxin module
MRYIILIQVLFLASISSFSQDISGKWTGSFTGQGNNKYKLEIDIVENQGIIQGVAISSQSSNFYGKASVKGSWYPGSGNLVLVEESMDDVKLKKGDSDVCKMTYELVFKKEKKHEFLEGIFSTTSLQNGVDCGNGKVKLERPATKDTTAKPVVKKEKEKKEKPIVEKTIAKKDEKPKAKPSDKPVKNAVIPVPTHVNPLKERDNVLFETIYTSEQEITIDFYDNGEIDGDTISIYDNGALRASGQGLSTQPVTIKLSFDDNTSQHEVVMVAENLGTIPPNSALMIIQAGSERYTVHLTSTENKNAMVLIKYKTPPGK